MSSQISFQRSHILPCSKMWRSGLLRLAKSVPRRVAAPLAWRTPPSSFAFARKFVPTGDVAFLFKFLARCFSQLGVGGSLDRSIHPTDGNHSRGQSASLFPRPRPPTSQCRPRSPQLFHRLRCRRRRRFHPRCRRPRMCCSRRANARRPKRNFRSKSWEHAQPPRPLNFEHVVETTVETRSIESLRRLARSRGSSQHLSNRRLETGIRV